LDSPLFQPNLARLPLPSPCTLRNILLHNLDITAIPRRYFFEHIANFTSDLTHKERLMEFCNPTYTDEFFDYTSRPRRSILEVLQDFPSVQIPFRFATSIFPVLRGRQFSIASCGFAKNTTGHPDPEAVRIDLCVALVKYKTVLKKVRQGVCSRYIASLKVGTDINITFQRGSFPRPMPLLLRPILMIAPGTGIAPMRALVHERLYQKIENQQAVGSATLIFGGRNITTDDLYCKELDSPQSDLTFFVAWSRAQKEKRYVQDIVREQAVLVWDIASKGRVSEEIAEGWVSELEKQGRYVQETW
jgi:sulfite reductase alpha subunit-like flavoprotein